MQSITHEKYNYIEAKCKFCENTNNNNFQIALHKFCLSQLSSVLTCFSYFNFFAACIIRGDQKKQHFWIWISSQAYPICLGYIERHKKFQGPSWSGSAASRYVISVTKIQRIFKIYNGGKNSTRLSIFLFWNKFLTKIGWPGVIAEVQTVV